MARIRTIKPEFFKHEGLAELPPVTRLLFVGMWCLCDSQGRMEDRPKRIKVELFPYDDVDIDTMLDELQSHGFIVRYEVDTKRCIEVPKFLEHQRITGTETKYPSKLPPPKEATGKQLGNNLEATQQQLGNNSDGRNKERERDEGKEIPLPPMILIENSLPEASLPQKLPPEFDDRLVAIWKRLVEAQHEANPKSKAMRLEQRRRYALSAALVEHTADELVDAWRWCLVSPSERAQGIRSKWSGIDTFLRVPLKYVEQSQNDSTGPTSTKSILDLTIERMKAKDVVEEVRHV